MDTREAFDILLGELRQALKQTKRAVSDASERSDFTAVRAAAERGEVIQQHIAGLKSLQRKWAGLVGERVPDMKEGKPAPPGESTPGKAFRLPILQALQELGGRGRVKQVHERVYEIMEDQLMDIDKEVLKGGQIRWKKNTDFARYHMVREGLLASGSPRGTWEITDRGREFLRRHSGG